MRMNSLLEKMLSDHTGQTVEGVRNDIKRDKILTAEEAVAYGLIDEVIQSRKTSQLATSA
jgi:ATP-dependent Clp protease protease subunit